jgi:hypothetical protein
MEAQAAASENNAEPKAKWRVTNWAEYDRALVRRGDLSIWFDEEFVQKHWRPDPTGKRGAPMKYSDMAIQVLLMLKTTFKLPYRTLEGFGRSLMKLMGLEFDIPDHSHMSRRAKRLTVEVPRKARIEPSHIVVDSTGLKIYGEGEWKVRKHGSSQRRRWIKVHFAVDTDWGDSEVFAGLINQVEGKVDQIDGDGAYDTREAYEVAKNCGATLVVPPRENAVAWEEGHPRTEALGKIKEKGMAEWKKETGYHRRSIAENAMYRFKQLFGDRLASRGFMTQVVEVHARVAAMNIMTYLGMPISVRVV